MYRLLKWEIIRRVKDQGYFYAVLAVCLAASYLLKNVTRLHELIPIVSSLYAFFLFLFISVYSVVSITCDVRKSIYIVERLAYEKVYKTLGVKFISNLIFLTIAHYGLNLLEQVLLYYKMEHTSYLIYSVPIYFVFLFSLILPCIFFLIYNLALSFTFTKQFPFASTVVVSGILILGMLIPGISILIKQYVTFQRSSISVIVNILVFSLLFYACCKLYEKKFEITI